MLIFAMALTSDVVGEWMVFDTTNNITNERRISAINGAEDDTRDDKPSIFVECTTSGKATLSLFASERGIKFGEGQRPVYLQFLGNGQAIPIEPEFWRANDFRLTYVGDAMDDYVLTASRTPLLEVSVLTDQGRVTARYLTDGLEEAYNYLTEKCPLARAAE